MLLLRQLISGTPTHSTVHMYVQHIAIKRTTKPWLLLLAKKLKGSFET
jgi:hypothetical protein